MPLPITLTIAAAAALINLWLAYRIIRIRIAGKIMIGDGGNPLILKRMRAQSNFVEYTPIVLILLGLVEAARGTHTWLWAVGIIYVLARIAHAFGLDGDQANAGRGVGILVTWLVTLVLAGYALWIVYTLPAAASLLVTAP